MVTFENPHTMKNILIVLTSILMSNAIAQKSLHDFEIQMLDAKESLKFSEFKGKKVLIVNVASKCGYTKQYADLQALQEKYADKLVVVGFPCNQFGRQEPGTEGEIAQFCSKNYGVTFPMTTKIDVKGKEQHDIYQFLTSKEQNGLDDYKVSWNFNKFLVDENGKLIQYFPSGTAPLDEKLTSKL